MIRTEQVLLNDFKKMWADVSDAIHAGLERVGSSGWYVMGPELEAFESNLAAYWGLPQAVGCGNGMDAIEIGLRALGLRPGDKVLTTPLSAFATTLAILRCQGLPVFVDTDESGLIDLDLAEAALRKDPSIRFMVPVHLYGHAFDLERLKRIKNEYQIRIIEDCAQSIGAAWNGVPVGAIGDLATTSFYPTKNLGAIGDGGAMLTANIDLAKKLRVLRDYGQSAKYVHTELGMNSRLDTLQAAFLSDVFLKRLPQWTVRRVEVANSYQEGIRHASVKPFSSSKKSKSVWHLYPLRVEGDRDAFQNHLAEKKVSSAIHYPGLTPDQPAMNQVKFEIFGSLNVALRLTKQEVSIPIHPYLDTGDVHKVIDAVNSWKA